MTSEEPPIAMFQHGRGNGSAEPGWQSTALAWRANRPREDAIRARSIFVCLVCLVVLASMACAGAPTVTLRWVEVYSSPDPTGYRDEQARGLAVDPHGNVYVSGETNGSIGGPATGDWDFFLAKIGRNGQRLWQRQFGTEAADFGKKVACDPFGGVYVTGSTRGQMGDNPNKGSLDAALVKFSSEGVRLWTRQIGTARPDEPWSIAADAGGNVYIAGATEGGLGGKKVGSRDGFIAKFAPDGAMPWLSQFGCPGDPSADYVFDVSASPTGDVFAGGASFPAPGFSDAAVSKVDGAGQFQWITLFGTDKEDRINCVAADGLGNVYVGGYTDGVLNGDDADPAGGRQNIVAKLDAGGNRLWTRQLPETADWGGLWADDCGVLFAAGYAGTSVLFRRFDSQGDILWSVPVDLGQGCLPHIYDLVVDSRGDFVVCGWIWPHYDSWDALAAKFAVPEPAAVSVLALGGLVLLRRSSGYAARTGTRRKRRQRRERDGFSMFALNQEESRS